MKRNSACGVEHDQNNEKKRQKAKHQLLAVARLTRERKRRGKNLELRIETQPECETILVGYLVGMILVKLKILWR